ncbi:pyridoxamine 5'-phosphate oxidase family protein [Halorussus pelagicus]|uniref:pyridoxamine 5'-phosphate oxidase family protein n=1 Tax=Halorussus pelagicus TaxID=2505977 RepID=UPI000FFC5260|nr:pyridoxamine 5'-phosphate oxidase family protein [Halorussus pelagicus]
MFTDDVVETNDEGVSGGERSDVKMNSDAASAFLERKGWGCLTLAEGGNAYSLPMSFGYDGEGTAYFHLQTDERGEKMAYLDATESATLLVPEVRPPDWTSVMVRGPIERVPEAEVEDAYAAFAGNAWFPASPWTDDRDPTELGFYKLEAETVTGRTSLVSE